MKSFWVYIAVTQVHKHLKKMLTRSLVRFWLRFFLHLLQNLHHLFKSARTSSFIRDKLGKCKTNYYPIFGIKHWIVPLTVWLKMIDASKKTLIHENIRNAFFFVNTITWVNLNRFTKTFFCSTKILIPQVQFENGPYRTYIIAWK